MPIFSSTITDHVSNTMPQPYYRFDGVDDWINFGNVTVLDGATACTHIVLFRTTANAAIYCKARTHIAFIMRTGDDKMEYLQDNGTTYATATSTVDVIDGNWHVGAGVWDGSTLELYVDGVDQQTAEVLSGGTFPVRSGQDWAVGALSNSGNPAGFYNGEVARALSFNLALSATEIKELYSGGSVPFKYKGANQTNLVTNGTFASDTSWTHGSNSSISGSKLVLAGMPIHNATYQEVSNIVLGKMYRITFTVSDFSAGEVMSMMGANQAYGTPRTANGTFTQDWRATFSTTRIGIVSGGTTTAKVDDFSVVQIGAVAEYDGSTAGAHQWGDKSGNELHGTVGDGAGGATAPTLENTPYDTGTEYEEGTWTPVYAPATGSFATMTMDIMTATYIKIGNKVTLQAGIRTDDVDVTGGSDDLRLNGLPFNAASGSVSFPVAKNFAAGKYPIGGNLENSYIILTERATITGTTNECAVDTLTDGTNENYNLVVFSATYIAS